MKIIRNVLENEMNIRTEKDYPIKGIEFIDIMPLLMQKNVYNEIIDRFCEEIKKYDVDYIIAPEARGFLLGSTIAHSLDVGCIPVRKKGKLPPTTVEAEATYEKEYGKDVLEIPKLVADNYKGKKLYIVDDIYATGNTFNAIKKTLEDLGGNVVGEGVILNIIELNNNKELFSLVDVNEE